MRRLRAVEVVGMVVAGVTRDVEIRVG